MMRRSLMEFSVEPLYNMKAVEQQTGISAPTLRAWERRYHLIAPRRTDSGYRLYSEQDIALLRWVRSRIDEGLTVGRVAAILDGIRTSGDPFVLDDSGRSAERDTVSEEISAPQELIEPLYDALIARNEAEADQILARAYAMYKLPTIFKDLLTPVMVRIGEGWHRGEVLISVEHFATNFIRGRLLTLFQSYPNRAGAPLVLVACAPGETHEVGILMLAVLLRLNSFNVVYLGQDMPIDDLIVTAREDRAAAICISAHNPATAAPLTDVQAQISRRIPAPAPYFIFGGQAFDFNTDLRETTPGHYLGRDTQAAVLTLNSLLKTAS